MKVDQDVVGGVTNLAKLRLDTGDIDTTIDRMSRILDLVEQMQEVDTAGVEPMAHPLDAVQRLREDRVTETDQQERYQAIAPETAGGLYLVPRVVE
ncbi:MAG: Asp-tRNA(Asn)/Glu-tRNA(Gln) amidotransferase subunit GatC [Gammaproteobacteria bacterium]|nr:Asp-tRNA(Asn)/Glu-tRNA(Gln) amidotransferase subunit GatC [Gammaproteobacteria bacterium]